jgi:hypothetical protein
MRRRAAVIDDERLCHETRAPRGGVQHAITSSALLLPFSKAKSTHMRIASLSTIPLP